MAVFYTILVALAVIIAIAFSLLVLLTGKGDAMNGGGSVRTTFKGRATFDDIISRWTLGLGVGFMAIVLLIDVVAKGLDNSNRISPSPALPAEMPAPTTNAPTGNAPVANTPDAGGAANVPGSANVPTNPTSVGTPPVAPSGTGTNAPTASAPAANVPVVPTDPAANADGAGNSGAANGGAGNGGSR